MGPDGLVPQFDKKSDEEFCPDEVTPRDNKGHCHDDDVVVEPTETFTIEVTGDIFGTDDGGVAQVVYTNASGGGPRALGVYLKLSDDILAQVTCGVDDLLPAQPNPPLPDPLFGNLSFGNFLNDYIIIFFDYMGAQHWFESPAGAVVGSDELPEPWPPILDHPVTVQTTGEWRMHTRGQNHQDGCTGEGVGITWTALVTNTTPQS